MTGKRIFHRTRQPSAVFMYDSNIYSGKLAGFWDKGLEIYVSKPIAIDIGTLIFSLERRTKSGISRLDPALL